MKKYYELIKDFLIDNSILPNEELFIFFKKLKGFSTNDKKYTENTNYFVFQYEKDLNNEKNILNWNVRKDEKDLIFYFRGKSAKYNYLSSQKIFKKIYSMYEDFCTKLKYNLENVDYNILYEIIINIVYCNNKNLRICTNLINLKIALEKWENDLATYKALKSIRPEIIKDNNI